MKLRLQWLKAHKNRPQRHKDQERLHGHLLCPRAGDDHGHHQCEHLCTSANKHISEGPTKEVDNSKPRIIATHKQVFLAKLLQIHSANIYAHVQTRISVKVHQIHSANIYAHPQTSISVKVLKFTVQTSMHISKLENRLQNPFKGLYEPINEHMFEESVQNPVHRCLYSLFSSLLFGSPRKRAHAHTRKGYKFTVRTSMHITELENKWNNPFKVLDEPINEHSVPRVRPKSILNMFFKYLFWQS